MVKISVPTLVFIVGLVPSACFAQVGPLTPTDARDSVRTERQSEGHPGALPRGEASPPFGTMRDELENYPIDTSVGGAGLSAPPTSFTGPSGFDWGNNTITGQGNIDFVSVIDLSGAPVGGSNGVVNATQALRIRTAVAQTAGGFFTGGSLRWNSFAPLRPLAGQNARVSAELFISTIAELYTFEASSSLDGFITGRLYWGGFCVENEPGECTDIGLPIGPVTTIYSLAPCASCLSTGIFQPARYCTNAGGQPIPGCIPPVGAAQGDPVSPPIALWARWAQELTSDGHVRYSIDLLDGQPEFLIYDNTLLAAYRVNRVASNSAFQTQDAYLLMDNFEASGPLDLPPVPPALVCPYLDDLEWLNTGFLGNQSERWTAALLSVATVTNATDHGHVISQVNNVSPDDYYRREFSTQLPPSTAALSHDVVVSVDALRTSSGTVRGFALFDGAELAARLIVGSFNPDTFELSNHVFVQINPDYQPIDDPLDDEPLANAPVNGVDVIDTGFDFTNAAYHTLTLRLSANGALRVSVDGQRIYTGPSGFTNALDTLAFESENNALGSGASLRIDNVALGCAAPSCATDFDFDDATTFADLNAVLSNFGASDGAGFAPGDANLDGAIDFADLNAVLSNFGTSCD